MVQSRPGPHSLHALRALPHVHSVLVVSPSRGSVVGTKFSSRRYAIAVALHQLGTT